MNETAGTVALGAEVLIASVKLVRLASLAQDKVAIPADGAVEASTCHTVGAVVGNT